MATYLLDFDPAGRNPQTFTVPEGRRIYLVRTPEAGTATVIDILSLSTYTLRDGVTIMELPIPSGTRVSLAFMERSNPKILFVNAEVIHPRHIDIVKKAHLKHEELA